jgi:hypothetical protein
MSLIHNNRVLWTLQALLALLFVFAGVSKLVMPAEQMITPESPSWITLGFLRFIAVMELLGAAGLVLPGLFRIRQELTPLAATGLVVIMIGATIVSAMMTPAAAAVLPFVTGVLLVIVAVGRRSTPVRSAQPARSY